MRTSRLDPRQWAVTTDDIPRLRYPGRVGLFVAGPTVTLDGGGCVHTDFLPVSAGTRLVGWAMRTAADTGGGTVTMCPAGATAMDTGVAFLVGRYIRGEREWSGEQDLTVVTVGVAPGPEDLDVSVTPMPHRVLVGTGGRTVSYTVWELLAGG